MKEDILPPKGYKQDDRKKKGLWAPGNYLRVCTVCGEGFVGDKRSLHCADCEYEGELK
jgi:hypothetical protein